MCKKIFIILLAISVINVSAILASELENNEVINKLESEEQLDDQYQILETKKEPINFEETIKKVVSIKSLKSTSYIDENTNSKKYYEYEEDNKVFSIGSGFFISEDGIILTNSHVVEDADRILVEYQGNSINATLIGFDPVSDVALLKIKNFNKIKFPYFELNKKIKYSVGDTIYAIGNPYNLGISISKGIISAVSRNLEDELYNNLIQTDAVINKGNSGGAMVNEYGELIAINNVIYSKNSYSTGISFAIPVANITDVVDQIIRFGYIQHGWIGIESCRELNAKELKIFGIKNKSACMITKITKDSPAEKANIKVSDIILSYNGNTFTTFTDFVLDIRNTNVGSKMEINIFRNNMILKPNVTIEEFSIENRQTKIKNKIKNNTLVDNGVVFIELNKSINELLNIDSDERGLYIFDIKKGSQFEKLGVNIGDILLNINQITINTRNDYSKTMNYLKSNNVKSYFTIFKQNNGNNVILINE